MVDGRMLRIPRLLAASAIGFLASCPDEQGPIDDCPSFTEMAACEDGSGCVWDEDGSECVVDCAAIDERKLCNEQEGQCFWDGRDCHYGVL
jgi:hypothetical protein